MDDLKRRILTQAGVSQAFLDELEARDNALEELGLTDHELSKMTAEAKEYLQRCSDAPRYVRNEVMEVLNPIIHTRSQQYKIDIEWSVQNQTLVDLRVAHNGTHTSLFSGEYERFGLMYLVKEIHRNPVQGYIPTLQGELGSTLSQLKTPRFRNFLRTYF